MLRKPHKVVAEGSGSHIDTKKLDLKSNCATSTLYIVTTHQPQLIATVLGVGKKPNTTTISIWFQSARRQHK